MQEMINEVENQARESLQHLGIKRTEIQQDVQMTEAALGKAETLLTRSPSAEIMQPNEILNKIFQAEVKQDDPGNRDIEIFLEFDFVKNQKLLRDVSANKIGCVKRFLTMTRPRLSSAEGKGINEATAGLKEEFILTTRNAEEEQCYQERDCVTVEIRNQQGNDCATKAQAQDNRDGTYKISYFAKETGKCEASVKVNEEHVHGSPFNIQVKPRQFRPVLYFSERSSAVGMLNKPGGVAVNERDEIAVTDVGNKRVQIFSSDGTLLRSISKEGNKQGELDWPTGIAFDKNGNIAVVDGGKHCSVQFFSEQGEYLSQFGEKGNFDHQLMKPSGLFVNCDGNIIVADKGNKVVKIFSPSGQLLQKVGGDGSLTEPVHCIEYEKNLIVSDRKEHCVKVFNRDGSFLCKFGMKGQGDGEFSYPGFLSVNKVGHLMVCDIDNHRVQVFELSGKFITKFGTKGRGIGEFGVPISTAVLSDGRIVVTDFRNSHIQIFE